MMSKINSERSRKLAWNIVASFLVKGWAAMVVLLLLPLTLHCLGAYKNGVWLTISSILVWIDQMDIGLGNGLRNRLAARVAHGEMQEAQSLVSSTVVMLILIMLPTLVILVLLVWLTDVYAFLGVSSDLIPELRTALMCGVTLTCITFVLKFIGNVYMAMQLPVVSNLLMAMGQTIALAATWLLYTTGEATFLNIVLVNTAAPLAVYALAYPYAFCKQYPCLRPSLRSVSMGKACELARLGVKFFLLQMAGVVQFMSANLIISKAFTPEMVTPYQVAYRYISIVVVVFAVVCMPFWSATTDAYERGDMQWIRQADRKMHWVMAGVVVMLTLMVAVSPWVYGLWIGDDCNVPFGMTVMMAFFVLLMLWSMRYSYFLNGIGALRLQLYMWVMPLLFIPLAWLVCSLTQNIMWFMVVLCFCTAPSVVVNMMQFHKIMNGTAKGIWRI